MKYVITPTETSLTTLTFIKVYSHYESNAHWKQINLLCSECALTAICIECAFSQSTSIRGFKPV